MTKTRTTPALWPAQLLRRAKWWVAGILAGFLIEKKKGDLKNREILALGAADERLALHAYVLWSLYPHTEATTSKIIKQGMILTVSSRLLRTEQFFFFVGSWERKERRAKTRVILKEASFFPSKSPFFFSLYRAACEKNIRKATNSTSWN